MKLLSTGVVICFSTLFYSCSKKEASVEDIASKPQKDLELADMPILPLSMGDWWQYKVRVEVGAQLAKEATSAIDTELEKKRTYLGKISPGEGLPKVDTFDVTVQGKSIERELVEIYDDRILMRGSSRPDVAGGSPLWLDTAIPFVTAGMRPGVELGPLSISQGASNRVIKVVARETIKVPAGEFPCIRLLMTGNDGDFEIRKTTWFSPGIGIVKEEKSRYAADQLIFSESTDLIETSVGK